jgi:sensor histidine kinase YesM
VTITARRVGGDLVLTVRDDGPGVPASLTEGVGLGNTRARLATLYGNRASLGLEATPGGGATVTVRLPYREHA